MLWPAVLLLQAAAATGGSWLDVPFVHQQKNGCGSASVWMVMQYWQGSSTPDAAEIHQALFSKEADGVYASDMELYLRRHGFQTFVLRADWDELTEELTKGRPLIVALEPAARRVPLHYVVIAGIDADRQLVWLNDPAERKLLPVRRRQFEKEWSSTDNWALLALPESEPTSVETPPPFSEAVLHRSELALASSAFREKHYAEAEEQLKSVVRADPEDRFASDFLGTVYLLDNNLPAALKYWDRAGKPRVREIHIDPPLRLDPVRLDHTFALSRAGVLTPRIYEETRQRLDSLGIFPRYEIELAPSTGEDFDVTFRASERNGPDFLSWIRGLPYQTVYPAWWNIKGRAINIQSLIRWEAGNRRALVGISSPLHENSTLGYRIQADGRNENWQYGGERFNLRRDELTGDIRAIFGNGWDWTNGVAATHRTFTNSFAGGNSVSYRTVVQKTVFRIPERRLTIDASAGAQLGKLFGAASDRFLKTHSDVVMRWFLFRDHNNDYETKVQLHLGKSFGTLPFDELFLVGLDRDSDLRLRAHPSMESGLKGAAPMARDYALLNSDFAKRLYSNGLFRLDGGPFLDTARIPSQAGWLVDAGIQLRVSVLSTFNLGISFGRNLRTGSHAIFIDEPR